MAQELAAASIAAPGIPAPGIPAPGIPARAELELDEQSLYLTTADGRWRRVALAGARMRARDASYQLRFVRHAVLRVASGERVDLITPPEEGAIAPRAARLPGVPGEAVIVSGGVWDVAVAWIGSGGGLSGRTIMELAQLACVATVRFAIVVGEVAAHVAAEMTWDRLGPMRGGGDLQQMLRPLEIAARTSARAGDALVAALSLGAVLQPLFGAAR